MANNEISRFTNLILHVIFIILSITCLLPIVLVFMISITDYDYIVLNGYQFIPEKLSLEAYAYIFKDYSVVLKAYGVSFFVTSPERWSVCSSLHCMLIRSHGPISDTAAFSPS